MSVKCATPPSLPTVSTLFVSHKQRPQKTVRAKESGVGLVIYSLQNKLGHLSLSPSCVQWIVTPKLQRDNPANIRRKSVTQSGLLGSALSITDKNSTWEVNLLREKGPSLHDVINA